MQTEILKFFTQSASAFIPLLLFQLWCASMHMYCLVSVNSPVCCKLTHSVVSE